MEGAWDQQLHAMDYLVYAYLQGAQDLEVRRVLDELKAIQKTEPVGLTAAYAFAAIPARYALERRRWSEAVSITAHPSTFPWGRFPFAEAIIHFSRAIGAARSGDADSARKDVEKLKSLHNGLVAAKESYWADQVEILRREAAAWLAHAQEKNEEALKLLRSAADLEDATEKHPVTPGSIVPGHEFLGDLLLELNEPRQALIEFETSLRTSPNRFTGLYGAARAAELVGDLEKARTYYEKLVSLCNNADSERPELRKAKVFLAKK
jgi:tetratricopeptide (TPR) repeat protein